MKFIIAFLLLFLSTMAYADVIDPSESICENASENDRCMVEGRISGTCQPSECCRLVYGGDDGPTSECFDCLKCLEASAATGGTDTNPQAGSSTTQQSSSGGSTSGDSAGGVDSNGSGEDEDQSSTDKDNEDTGCDSSVNTPRNLGVLSILLGLILTVRLRRTRI